MLTCRHRRRRRVLGGRQGDESQACGAEPSRPENERAAVGKPSLLSEPPASEFGRL